MAKTDTLHIRIEPDMKKKAEKTLSELGLSLTDAINVFLAQVILQDGFPFEIKKPKFNKDTIEAIEDAKNNKNLSREFETVDELFEELNN